MILIVVFKVIGKALPERLETKMSKTDVYVIVQLNGYTNMFTAVHCKRQTAQPALQTVFR